MLVLLCGVSCSTRTSEYTLICLVLLTLTNHVGLALWRVLLDSNKRTSEYPGSIIARSAYVKTDN